MQLKISSLKQEALSIKDQIDAFSVRARDYLKTAFSDASSSETDFLCNLIIFPTEKINKAFD